MHSLVESTISELELHLKKETTGFITCKPGKSGNAREFQISRDSGKSQEAMCKRYWIFSLLVSYGSF